MTLRKRGINVDRILKAREQEARLAEELRLKENAKQRELDAEAAEKRHKLEQERIRQLEYSKALEEKRMASENARRQSLEANGHMPGSFEDSPPRKKDTNASGGFFKGLTKRLGLDQDTKANEQLKSLLGEKDKSGSSGSEQSSPQTPTPGTPEPIRKPGQAEKPTEPHRILSNLHTAISRSRAHNSTEVVSQGRTFEVKEDTTYCDKNSAHDIVVCGETSSGMKAYLDRSLLDQKAELMKELGPGLNKFAHLLEAVSRVYEVPRSSVHIYYNLTGESIAFNLNGALFFNFR